MKPKFESTGDGLEIIDPIERHRYRLLTHGSVDPELVDTDRIQFPVSSAVEITTDMITLPTNESVFVRDEDGSMIAEVRPNKQISLPLDKYTLDLSGSLKVYAYVKSSVYIYSDSEQTYISLDESTHTTIGARSYHRRPAGTVTTTEEPTDVMKAVSSFGSALKSTTPDRSYPTHRGHPPTVKLGNKLNIPEKFERIDTGIQIEVPPKLRDIFVVSPLAYYLGAEIISGSKPRLITEDGFTHDLDGIDGFELSVERVLKQIFFLDCVIRSEGATPLPLHERKIVEPKLKFDIETVYEQPLSEQIKTYLTISFDTVSPYLMDWQPETHLKPTARSIEFLPFLIDSLSIIRIQNENTLPKTDTQAQVIEDFTRKDFVRSTSSTRGSKDVPTFIESDIQTVQQTWGGIDSSDVISTTPLSAFYHSIGQTPRDDPIEIDVVCNDQDMRDELETVDRVYGKREELPFNVSIYHGVKTAKLEDILAKESDFTHFIGHIDEDGFQCTDGKLDASLLKKSGSKAFFLNACQSYEQGIQLVEAGSIGGIVTLNDVINSGAVKVGCMIARLLNRGFPLYAALDVAQRSNIIGHQYSIVGNGKTTIAQPEAAPPNVCLIEENDDSLDVGLNTYTTTKYRKGSLFIPYIDENEQYFLTSGRVTSFSLTRTQLVDFLKMEQIPIISSEGVDWSEETALEEL